MEILKCKLGLTPAALLAEALSAGMPPEKSNDFCAKFTSVITGLHTGTVELAIRMENRKLTICGEAQDKEVLLALLTLAEMLISKEIRGDLTKNADGLLHQAAALAVVEATDINKLQPQFFFKEKRSD